MAIGPVQLLVLGFKQPDFQGEIRQELDRLRDNDLVRVIDALAVRKDADGNVEVLHESQLSDDEQAAFGALVGGLIGLGAAGEEGFEIGAERGAEAVAERGGVFSEEAAWDVLEEIPPDTAGLLILLEHRWAIPLRDAIARAGGFRLASEFISPLDLVAVGLVEAEEAEALASAERDALCAHPEPEGGTTNAWTDSEGRTAHRTAHGGSSASRRRRDSATTHGAADCTPGGSP
jgi:uncharacterized membrane protein